MKIVLRKSNFNLEQNSFGGLKEGMSAARHNLKGYFLLTFFSLVKKINDFCPFFEVKLYILT